MARLVRTDVHRPTVFDGTSAQERKTPTATTRRSAAGTSARISGMTPGSGFGAGRSDFIEDQESASIKSKVTSLHRRFLHSWLTLLQRQMDSGESSHSFHTSLSFITPPPANSGDIGLTNSPLLTGRNTPFEAPAMERTGLRDVELESKGEGLGHLVCLTCSDPAVLHSTTARDDSLRPEEVCVLAEAIGDCDVGGTGRCRLAIADRLTGRMRP